TDATQAVLISTQTAAALDEARAQFNGAMAAAKTDDERRQAQQQYDDSRGQIIGGAVVSTGMMVVSVVGGVVGAASVKRGFVAGPAELQGNLKALRTATGAVDAKAQAALLAKLPKVNAANPAEVGELAADVFGLPRKQITAKLVGSEPDAVGQTG